MSPKVLALSQAKMAVMYLFTILLSKAMDSNLLSRVTESALILKKALRVQVQSTL